MRGETRFSEVIEFLRRNVVLQCGVQKTQQTAAIVLTPPPRANGDTRHDLARSLRWRVRRVVGLPHLVTDEFCITIR